jgi:hypothetical protein
MPGIRVLECILQSQLHSQNPEWTLMAQALRRLGLVSSESCISLNSAIRYTNIYHEAINKVEIKA